MTQEQFRQQTLIESFPDESRKQRIRTLWAKQKKDDSLSLKILVFGVCPAIAVLMIALITFYWADALDSSPVVGIIILAVASSILFFRSKVWRVWEWIKRKG